MNTQANAVSYKNLMVVKELGCALRTRGFLCLKGRALRKWALNSIFDYSPCFSPTLPAFGPQTYMEGLEEEFYRYVPDV